MNIKSFSNLLEIVKQGRKKLISDFYENNGDLFDPLYESVDSEITKIMAEFYELKWIQYYFDLIKRVKIEDKAVYSVFIDFYKDYIKDIYSAELDPLILDTKIRTLDAMISQNDKWEDNIKRIKVSCKREKKLLEQRLEVLKSKKGL